MNLLRNGLSLLSSTISGSARQTINATSPLLKNWTLTPPSLPLLSFERFRSMQANPKRKMRDPYWFFKDMHDRGHVCNKKQKKKPLDGNPFLKGIVLKTLIKKPKKPNSANRKCVLVRLSNGKEMVAYVPGIGHNLQEHNIVLVRCGKVQDTPGIKLKCVRGAYDLPHVIKTDTSIKKS